MRIAVVGSGVAGLAAARELSSRHEVVVFERAARAGGHVNTVPVELNGIPHVVDVGFVVFNELTYPRFGRMLDDLGVATQASDMTFSVSAPDVEYAGTGLRGVFAQPVNALRPSYLRMLGDVVRFNRRATAIAAGGGDDRTVVEFLADERFGRRFAEQFLVPLGAAVWSVAPARFATTPIHTLAVFLQRHDFLRVRGRPVWRSIAGGASSYVDALVAQSPFSLRTGVEVRRLERQPDGVRVVLDDGHVDVDRVVVAAPSDLALGMLERPTPTEQSVLGAFAWTTNQVTLHHDARLMPHRRHAWASWNAHVAAQPVALPQVTYWMNRLQRIDSSTPLLVTLNRDAEIDPALVRQQWQMRHPVIDTAALRAQVRLDELNRDGPVHYCGAYWGSGFHEDGLASAARACAALERTRELAA